MKCNLNSDGCGARRSPGIAKRPGFALFTALVTIAVIAVLATVIVLSLNVDFNRIAIAQDSLFRFKTEIIGVPPSFFTRINTYPGHLSDLVQPITTLQTNSCGNFYKSSPDVNNWQGPYHLVPFNPALGYTMARGLVANDSTRRTTFTDATPALAIVMVDVQLADAQALKARVDGIIGDTVAFTPNGSNPITVLYRMPSTGAC